MAITLTQQKPAATTGANATFTYTSTPAVGSLLVVTLAIALAAGSVTDPAGWTRRGIGSGGGGLAAIIIEKIAGASEPTTVAFTNASAAYEVEGTEWAGNAASGSEFDASDAGNTGATVTSLQPGSLTPAGSGELLVVVNACSGSITAEAVDSGFTALDAATFVTSLHAYKIKTDAAAENPTVSWTTGRNAKSVMCGFIPAAAGGIILPDYRDYPIGVDRGVNRGVI